MAARDFLFLSGKLVKDPTDLTAAFPHGGTALGDARDMVFAFGAESHPIRAEEFGGQVVEYIRGAEQAALTALLRGYDQDALEAVFPNVSVGSTSQKPHVKARAFGSGNVRSGALASDLSAKILVSPDDGLHPALLLRNAISLVEEAARLQLELAVEGGIAVAFRAVPDASGRIWDLARLKDLTL